MKLTDQVISLSLAKRLKELGVKQENSLFYWDTERDTLMMGQDGGMPRFYTGDGRRKGGGIYTTLPERTIAAFTVAELGEMLPEATYSSWYVAMKDGAKWQLWEIEHGFYGADGNHIYADTEAEARGLMLAYLIENKLISV